jgi:hypothetical protein
MDVTSVSPGTTVRCPDCGNMARVPTGNTSLRAKTVSAPIPAKPPPPAPAPAARERGTRVRDRNRASGTMPVPPPKKSSKGGLFIGLGIGAVAVIGVVVFFLMREQPKETPPVTTPRGTGAIEKEPVVFRPKLPPMSDKPIKLGEPKAEDPKPTVIARPSEAVDNVDWDRLMRDLRPGGGFEHLDRPEGVAFQKVKSFGKAAYPKLIQYIYLNDEQEPTLSVAAVAVLNALTGRDMPLPKAVNRAKVKAEWEEWLKSPEAAKEPPK